VDIGKRVVVIGNTAAGKSSLGAVVARTLGVPLVDLDALYWRPNWQRPGNAEFATRVAAATVEAGWVVAGNYESIFQAQLWPRADTLIFLDYALHIVLIRLLRRAWSRWRSRELLWSTNRESLTRYASLKDWRRSLIPLTLRRHAELRRRWPLLLTDPRLGHLRFVRLCSPAETALWLAAIEAQRSLGSFTADAPDPSI
jgi:adenylate kinase family enzyme